MQLGPIAELKNLITCGILEVLIYPCYFFMGNN